MPKLDFTNIYLVFLIVSSVFRIRSLSHSYQRPVGVRGKVYVAGSYTIVLVIYLTISLVAVLEFFLYRSSEINILISLLGITLYIVAAIFREKAVADLGEYMSPEIEIKHSHQLVRTGIYQYARHPLSLCLLAEISGFALIPNSYYALAGGLTVLVPFLFVRAYLEEQVMLDKFGREYQKYKKEVYAFLPVKKSN